jgi:hypothetical protein
MNEKEYQTNELMNFLNSKSCYFDNLADFEQWLLNTDLLEQIEWIENGSYGCGSCLALQRTFKSLNNRTNKQARIGNVILHCFFGKRFDKWNKLSKSVQNILNDAIQQWLEQEKSFAIESII